MASEFTGFNLCLKFDPFKKTHGNTLHLHTNDTDSFHAGTTLCSILYSLLFAPRKRLLLNPGSLRPRNLMQFRIILLRGLECGLETCRKQRMQFSWKLSLPGNETCGKANDRGKKIYNLPSNADELKIFRAKILSSTREVCDTRYELNANISAL